MKVHALHMRLRLHVDETKSRWDTNTLNPLKEELEMDEAWESEGWERNWGGVADGQKDVNPFHSSETA